MKGRRILRVLARASLVLLVAFGAVLVAGWAFTFQVQETECALLTRFGRPVTSRDASGRTAAALGPGLHFRIPIVDRVYRFDRRIRYLEARPITLSTSQEKAPSVREDRDSRPGGSDHSEANVLVFHAYACWRVVDPLQFQKSMVGNYEAAARYLEGLITSQMGTVIGKSVMTDFFSLEAEDIRIDEIEAGITASVAGGAREKFGLQVLRVGFKRIVLASENLESVKARMLEERKTVAQRFRNEADEIYRRIIAEANKRASIVRAEADMKASQIVADGEAKAAEIYAAAGAKNPEFYRFYRSLTSLKRILFGLSSVVLSADAEPFKLLREAPPEVFEGTRK
jgi:membrane protease subunit HflC